MTKRPDIRSIRVGGKYEEFRPGSVGYVLLELLETTLGDRDRLAYQAGEWCGECRYGIVEDPPCCTQPAGGTL